MHWFNRLEHKFGHLAIPHLVRSVTVLSMLVFVLYKLNPNVISLLSLDPERIRAGEVWRCFSYIFIPALGRPLFDYLNAFFYFWFMWWIGGGLEQAMGSFRVNVFYLIGLVVGTAMAIIGGPAFAVAAVNSTLFYAFARYYPEETIYLFALIPIKVRWMAWIMGFFLVLNFLGGTWEFRLAVIGAFSNYLLFFGRDILRDAKTRAETADRRREFEAAQLPADEAIHHCAVCGRTEATHPQLDFRVSADGQEYCTEHLPRRA